MCVGVCVIISCVVGVMYVYVDTVFGWVFFVCLFGLFFLFFCFVFN